MDELHDLRHRNDKLKGMLQELFGALLQATGVTWFFMYFAVVFVVWWGFSQRHIALIIIATWLFEFAMRRFYQFIERKRDELDRLG